MRTEEEIRKRLTNVRKYVGAGWATWEMGSTAASELLWVLGYEEQAGENFLLDKEIFNEKEWEYERV